MSHPSALEHEIVRDVARSTAPLGKIDEKSPSRPSAAKAPVIERIRNVGGRLMV